MSHQFWKFIAIGLAFGVFLELIKTPVSAPIRLAGLGKFDTLIEEGKTVYVPEVNEVRPHAPERPRVSKKTEETPEPIAIVAENTENKVAPPAASPTPAPLTEEEKKKAEEEKKKKRELAKKKREKEKKKQKREEARQERERVAAEKAEEEARKKAEADKKAAEEIHEGVASPAPKPPTPAAGAPAPLVKIPQTVREWESLLLKEPDAIRTAQFVRYYQSGKVKAEVFFAILKLMFEDSRPKMRELGSKSASKVADSRSFILLYHSSQSESDPKIKAQSAAAVQTYARLENVGHLAGVLKASTDTQTAMAALELLKVSIDANLRNNVGQSSTNPQNDPRAPSAAAVARQYLSFLAPLQELSTKNQNPQLTQTATAVLNDLQTLLAAAGQPIPAPNQQQPAPAQQ